MLATETQEGGARVRARSAPRRSVAAVAAAAALCGLPAFGAGVAQAGYVQSPAQLPCSSFISGLSEAGTTALVGNCVFVRSGEEWSKQAELETSGVDALSADGNTAIVGSPSVGEGVGTATVYVRSGESWSQQAVLSSPEESGKPQFGDAVALSADGNTALVGAPYNAKTTDSGAAFVFKREGTTWTQEGPALTEPALKKPVVRLFGTAVALSSEATTAIVGTAKTGAWPFTRAAETWTRKTRLVGGKGEEKSTPGGSSVSLSSGGTTALVGYREYLSSKGAAYVFQRSGETWAQQGPKLTVASLKAKSYMGVATALSGNGNTALVGAPSFEQGTHEGFMFVYERSGETWSLRETLVPNGHFKGDEFGFGVALTPDASTAIIPEVFPTSPRHEVWTVWTLH